LYASEAVKAVKEIYQIFMMGYHTENIVENDG
jgi:hypothetical protein